MPGFGISILTAILPVILMLVSTLVQLITGHDSPKMHSESIIYLIGNAGTAMLYCSYLRYIYNGCIKT